jgi:hypothetical protein
MTNNNVIHITPPSLYINGDGNSILFLGFEKDLLEELQSIFERNLYESELQFFYSDKKNDDESIAWKYYIANEVNFIVINIDGSSKDELVIALMTDNNFDDKNIIFFSSKDDSSLSTIVQKYTGRIVKNLEDFEEILKFIIEE